jgi:ATP-binding cassette subfamily C protein CydD
MTSGAEWLGRRGRSARGSLAIAVALGEVSGLLLILQTALLASIVNAVAMEGKGLSALSGGFSLLLGVLLLRALGAWLSRRAAFECSSRVKLELRRDLEARLRSIGPRALEGRRSGEIAAAVVDAVEALDGYFSGYLPQRAIATLLPVTVLAVVFPLDWVSALVLVLTAAFLPVSMILIGEEAQERNRRLWSSLARMSGDFLDLLQGIATVKIFGAARRETERMARVSEEYRGATMSVLRVAFLSSFMLELLSALSIAIVAVLAGFRLLSGSMSFGPGYFILLVAPEYFLTLRNLGGFYHARMQALGAADRIKDLLEPAGQDSEAEGREAPGGEPRGPVAPAGRRSAATLAFEDVSLTGGGRPILEGVSFELAPAERITLSGPSGCGKTSILAAILGFARPSSGRITLGGLGRGAAAGAREGIAWLPQRPSLFHGTLADNIRLARASASDREVEEAAASAGVDEFLDRLPEGLATRVGEGGRGLSVGQVQRVALARLFLLDPGLVLLDEPFAHLDETNAAAMATAIAALTEGRTTILVSHGNAWGGGRRLVIARGRLEALD